MRTGQIFELAYDAAFAEKGDMLRGKVRYMGQDILCQVPVSRPIRCDRMVLVEIEPGEHGLADGFGVIFGRAGAAKRREFEPPVNPYNFRNPMLKNFDVPPEATPQFDEQTIIHLEHVMHLG